MQAAMDRLEGFLERRRFLVVGVWVLLLLAALPFAAKQTDHLTSGGFAVPGSGSEAVDRGLHRFDRAEKQRLGVILAQRRGGTPRQVRAEIDRVARIAKQRSHVALTRAAEQRAKREAGTAPIVVAPLAVSGSRDEVDDLAVDLRDNLGIGEGQRHGVQPYLVGQEALWAGMQDLSKKDL